MRHCRVERLEITRAHVQIRALFNNLKKHSAKPPHRTNIAHIIMPSMNLLNQIDSEGKMSLR
jgi:hypothetical protein